MRLVFGVLLSQLDADSRVCAGERFRSESKKKRKDKMLRLKQSRGYVMAGDTSVPLDEFADWNEFASSTPPGSRLVAIEMGGTPLHDFEHPLGHTTYILGSEDNGLPESVLRACDHHVALPSLRAESFNVAVAGSLVMYDRMVKLHLNPKP